MSDVFAYFVGIDRYAGNVASLQGCVNDVEALSAVLRTRLESAGDTLTIATLTNEDATRDAFITGFRTFFAASVEGDHALLYCSMHGSQEKAPPEFLRIEPDGYNETLVFHDSRTERGRDLADKELSVLIGELADRGVVVTAVLDCCHSGSGLRGIAPEVGVRCAPVDLRTRTAADYLHGAVPANAADLDARYTLLAACRSDQTAKETPVAGVQRGALSQALEQVLVSTPGALSNLQVHRAVSARVRSRVIDQTPQLECPVVADVDLPFLGGAAAASGTVLTVSHSGGRWQLDAGRLQGIPATGPGEGVRLALHLLDGAPPDTVLAVAVTTAVAAASSLLRFQPPGSEANLDPAAGYRAVVDGWPTPSTTVAVAADVPARLDLVTALTTAGAVAVADDPTDADLTIARDSGEVVIRRRGSTLPAIAGQPADSLDTEQLVNEISQLGRWLALSQLDNPGTTIGSDEVTLSVLSVEGTELPITDGGVELAYGGDGQQPRMQVRVRNRGTRRLFIALVDLSELYGVGVLNIEGGGLLDPPGPDSTGETYAATDTGTHDLYLDVPDGQSHVTDVLKLLVSTAPFDARDWALPDLAAPTRTRGATLAHDADSDARSGGGADKGISGRPAAAAPTDDWTTREVLVTTRRPLGNVTLNGTTASVELDTGVTLHVPAGFTGAVALLGHVVAGRDALVPLLPPVLADDPANEPFPLIPTRSVGAETDILQLSWNDNERGTAATITADNPLRLVIDRPLDRGEIVLPIAFDGTDYLPVGFGRAKEGRTEIVIDRLPATDVGLRSLGGSLKILFRKLVLRPVGADYDLPHLSIVDYSTTPPTYDWDTAHVQAALAGTATALLLVHGIIGDTIGMSASVGSAPPGAPALKDHFDVVLAFDYENINTPIEQTGNDLADRLRAVGIGPDSGPRVTAIVHSMGGLVTRSCIEQHGGSSLIERLITCGTPHGGSPWSRIEDLALSLIGLGLNGVVHLGGPLAVAGRVLGYLTKLVERVDTSLEEMNPQSPLLKALAADPDPGLPYTTIRGTRPWPDPADDGRAKRIIGKLATTGFDVVFGGAVNDMAVSVASASAVGSGWANPPHRMDADCNHISYFASDAGRAAIAAAVAGPA